MKEMKRMRVFAGLLLVGTLMGLLAVAGVAQEAPGDRAAGEDRPAQVDLFGGSAYEGGYLKYSYKVSREGVEGYSITTTEITPQEDGMYRIESSSSDVVPLDGVSIGFFGISLRGLGFRAPTSTGGTVDLSPLSAIEDEILEPNHEYVLPDGGFLTAEDAGSIAGLDVVYATYTHADYSNVLIHLAMPVDLAIRNLLPLFPYLELEYQASDEPVEVADAVTDDMPRMRSFSQVELIEFVYEP